MATRWALGFLSSLLRYLHRTRMTHVRARLALTSFRSRLSSIAYCYWCYLLLPSCARHASHSCLYNTTSTYYTCAYVLEYFKIKVPNNRYSPQCLGSKTSFPPPPWLRVSVARYAPIDPDCI